MNISFNQKVACVAVALGLGLSGAAQADSSDPFYSTKELNVIECSMPEYPRRAELFGLEGYALVEFSVMPDGSVAEPSVARSSSRLFSRAALDAIETWKFEPVIAEGKGLPVRSAMKFNFVAAE